ncbi:MAG: phytanoyl-CoA dioxygenase family protein [Planctomycetota bacterium]
MTDAALSTAAPAETDRFAADGYLVLRGLLPDAMRRRMLDVTRKHLADGVAPIEYEAETRYPGAPDSRDADGGGTARRLKAAHARDAVFTEWVNSEAVTSRLARMLGTPFVMPLAHHNCVMTKQPRFSSDTGWHQDVRYWSFRRPELVSVWAALGSERRENGCLRVIPGSHRVEYAATCFDADQFFRDDCPQNAETLARAVDVELDAGDVLFFHARLLHAATRNRTTEPKYSAVFTFRPDDNPPLRQTRSAELPELIFGTAS